MNLKEPDAFIFMKVGQHANEEFESILTRKNEEFNRTGRIFWGYGGTSCHPIRHVQPFAKMNIKINRPVYLLMEKIDSHAHPDIAPATEYSEDGIVWKPIPDGINVLGSRYALVLDEIKPGALDINIDNYEVGIGPSRGKSASNYIKGRIDKACLTRSSKTIGQDTPKKIELYAKLLEPYAVMLR